MKCFIIFSLCLCAVLAVSNATGNFGDFNAGFQGFQDYFYGNMGFNENQYQPNYAVASGSIGPGGFYQSTFTSPENPGTPNVRNRFSTSSGPGGPDGVSVSAVSSNINGVRYNGAQTTFTENGQSTTYRV